MAQGLGLGLGYGAAAAQDALRLLREAEIAEEERKLKRQQLEFENSLKLRSAGNQEEQLGLARKQLEFQMRPKPVEPEYDTLNAVDPATGQPRIIRMIKRGQGAGTITPTDYAPYRDAQGASSQRVEGLLDGRLEFADYVPGKDGPGKWFVGGQDVTGRFRPQPPREPAGGTMTDVSRFNASLRAANEWENDPLVKDARAMRTQHNRMTRAMDTIESALSGGTPDGQRVAMAAVAPAAEAVQVIFQKVLDPTSVVREGEFMRSMLTQSMVARITGYLDKLQKGGSGIPPANLREYVNLAGQFVDAINADAAKIRTAMTNRAKNFGLNPDDIFMDDIGLAAAGTQSVSMDELAALAKQRGTTVDQEKARATAAGYIIR